MTPVEASSIAQAPVAGVDLAVRPWFMRVAGQIWRFARAKPLGAISAIIIALLLAAAVFAPLIAPYNYTEKTGQALSEPSADNIMGTDKFGRDQFSRLVYGSRSTVKVGLGAAALATVVAVAVGLTSGFLGGMFDNLVQRIVEALMSLPWLVVVLAVMSFVGSGTGTVILVLGLLAAPNMSRVIRGATLSVREMAYIEAARAISASPARLIVRHTLPNILAPIIVMGTLAVGNAILAEAALSFLGFGITPPTPSWGQELSGSGRQYMQIAPWLAIFPGLAISITVFSFNMLGDALRDVLDPRLRNS